MLDRQLEPEVMDDPAEAAAYAAMDHGIANAAFVDRLIEVIGDEPRGVALDLGTGPGDIPILLCQRLARLQVVATDLAESMLVLAREKVARAGLADRIELRRADVKQLDLPDAGFEVVFSNTILHHIPEPIAMLREARRVLKPGGVLLIRDLFRPGTQAELDRLVAVHAAESDPEQRRLFAESLRAALTPEELATLALQAGMEGSRVTADTDRHMSLQWRCRL